MNRTSLLLRGVFALVVVSYPVLVYFGIDFISPAIFGLVLAVVLIIRARIVTAAERSVILPLLGVLLIYAIGTMLLRSPKFLLLYPVLVNFGLCMVFAWSLRGPECTLLRIFKARGIATSANSRTYLFRLTGVWAAFFMINGTVAMWTTTQSMETWTLYNGLISYALIALLVVGEMPFRYYYKRYKGAHQLSNSIPSVKAD